MPVIFKCDLQDKMELMSVAAARIEEQTHTFCVCIHAAWLFFHYLLPDFVSATLTDSYHDGRDSAG